MTTLSSVALNNKSLPYDLSLFKKDPFKQGLLTATAAYLSKANETVSEQFEQPVEKQNVLNKQTINEHGDQIYDLSGFQDDPFSHGFIRATLAYISNISQQQLDQTFNSMNLSKVESDLMSKYVAAAQEQTQKITQQMEQYEAEQSSANFLQKFLGYLTAGLMIIAGIITENPSLVAMGAFSIIMQASGGQEALQNALPSGSGAKAGLEFLISAGEALTFSALNPEAFVAKLAENFAMELMLNNFWSDLGKSMGMSDDDAMGFALFMGMTTSFAASAAAAKTASAAASSGIFARLRSFFAATFDEGATVYQNMMKAANLLRHGLQLGSGAMQVAEAQMLKKAADILDDMADSQKIYTVVQGMSDLVQQAMTITQDSASAVNNSYESVAQTYRALAMMLKMPRGA